MKYQALSKLSLKSHPELTERWVQDRIAEHPQIPGLGDVVLKDRETSTVEHWIQSTSLVLSHA